VKKKPNLSWKNPRRKKKLQRELGYSAREKDTAYMDEPRVVRLQERAPKKGNEPTAPSATTPGIGSRAEELQSALDVLATLTRKRIAEYVSAQTLKSAGAKPTPIAELFPHALPGLGTPLLTNEERIILYLGLVPHLRPDFFERIMAEALPAGGDFSIFGGIKGTSHRGILPTGETAQFLLGGAALESRLIVALLFESTAPLAHKGIAWLQPARNDEPMMSGAIVVAEDWVAQIAHDRTADPRFGASFPAKRISTRMNWEDVVLPGATRRQVEDLALWVEHHGKIARDENLGRKIKQGYRVLFHGPSGTGKTLTAALLGKRFARDVYRIDLSQVVSKYIGETEKNLEAVFQRAETKDWILFFDEADSLFGKRTNVQSSHDKYANQEVSYLLQRVEDFPGLLILASNFKSNLDEAFLRRFGALIHFPLPGVNERLVLWQKSLPASVGLDPDVDLAQLARAFELTGASILNAVQHALLRVFSRGAQSLSKEDLEMAIKREFSKEGRSI